VEKPQKGLTPGLQGEAIGMKIVYQHYNPPIHTRLVTEWFDEHGSEVEHLPWAAKSPDIYFEPLCGILEERDRKCFPPPAYPFSNKAF